MNFEDAFKKLIVHEGGYVNDPRDPGGETKYGISKRAYPAVDIKNLTLDGAKLIYKRDYWDRCRCDDLPEAVRFDVFDAAVNSGVKQAIVWLQRALGVVADGVIGGITLSFAEKTDGYLLAMKYNGTRLLFMTNLPTWPTYSKGWAKRIAENMVR